MRYYLYLVALPRFCRRMTRVFFRNLFLRNRPPPAGSFRRFVTRICGSHYWRAGHLRIAYWKDPVFLAAFIDEKLFGKQILPFRLLNRDFRLLWEFWIFPYALGEDRAGSCVARIPCRKTAQSAGEERSLFRRTRAIGWFWAGRVAAIPKGSSVP